MSEKTLGELRASVEQNRRDAISRWPVLRRWDAQCLTPNEVEALVANAERVILSDDEREWLDEEFGDAFTVKWCDAINRILLAREAD